MMLRRSLTILGVAALCGAIGFSAESAGNGGVQLGQNLAGESCRSDGALSLTRSSDILCGANGAVSGTFRSTALASALPADPAARREAIVRNALVVRSVDAGQVSCDAGQWLDPSNAASPGLLICTQQ